MVSKNLSMDVDVSSDGQVVEIEDESCIDPERRRARCRGCKNCRAGATHDARSWILGDVGKRGAESLKCN